jgi:hypothetical protein
LTELSLAGPVGVGPDIAASTSLAQLRAQVISKALSRRGSTQDQVCRTYDAGSDTCWNQQVDRQGRLYLAVITNPGCASSIKEASAVSGHTLYFIRWVGSAQGPCGAAFAQPNWRLYSASRSDLPSSGVLTVRLQFQGTVQGDVESQVDLT